MKKKILIIIYVILIFIILKLAYTNIINRILIIKYNNGEYSEKLAEQLTLFNFSQSYVADYNYGNILYQNGDYESAIEQYKKSLSDKTIPEDRECSVRINYALAICKTVKLDESDEQSIKKAISIYESAIDVLTEHGCANKNDDNGHSEKAEKLKKDIQNEIERLKKLLEENSNNKDEEKDEKEEKEKNEDEKRSEEIEAKIQDIKEEATKEQRESEGNDGLLIKDLKLFRREKNW